MEKNWEYLIISLTIDQINSIADRAGEFGGHFGIASSLILFPFSHVGMKLLPNRLYNLSPDLLEECTIAPSCWKNFTRKSLISSL